MVPQNGDWWSYSCTKADLLMFLLTPTSKAGNSRQIKKENGVLRSENSSSPRSGSNYHKQPFLLLSWKKARQRAAAQVKGSIAESREGSRQWRGDSLQRHTHTHSQHCRLPHGLGGPLKEAAAPSPLSQMLTPSPSPSPDGKQIWRKTPARHWAVQEREGFVLHTSQQPHHTPHREKAF